MRREPTASENTEKHSNNNEQYDDDKPYAYTCYHKISY